MKFTMVALLCFISIISKAQSFDELIQKGNSYYSDGDYAQSAKTYDEAFGLDEGTAGQYYNAACSWALTGDTIQSMKYLLRSTEAGWHNLSHFKRDSDLKSLHAVSGWEELLQLVQANLDEYEKDMDQSLKKRLEDIHVKDQTLRQLYAEAEEKFGRDTDEMNYFWDVILKQDSLNELEVLEIIEEKGWVGTSLVGGKANMTLWLVIQHAPVETQEKYLPLLRESVLNGESQGSHLALLEDRIQMRNGLPQTYGSQITRDEETGKQVVYEVKDPEYVNQRRKEVGLGPIEDYIKRWGLVWTIEQKEK